MHWIYFIYFITRYPVFLLRLLFNLSLVCTFLLLGAGSDNKQMNRVDAQSPNSSSQQQSSHSAPQQTLPFNIHYGYYLPGAAVLPGAAGFQFPPMYPVGACVQCEGYFRLHSFFSFCKDSLLNVHLFHHNYFINIVSNVSLFLNLLFHSHDLYRFMVPLYSVSLFLIVCVQNFVHIVAFIFLHVAHF